MNRQRPQLCAWYTIR